MTIIDCLVECEIAESKTEASRLIQQRAIKVDNKVVDRSFVFPLDVQSIESYEWADWYGRFCAGEFEQDIPFRTLGKLVNLVGAKGFNRQDLALSPEGTMINMILSETFLISRGKADYWVVRLSEVSPEVNEKLMRISLDEMTQNVYHGGT